MATRVDTWSPAPQTEGECTDTALFYEHIGRCRVFWSCPGACWRALLGPLSVHGMGCSTSHAYHVLVLKAETRTQQRRSRTEPCYAPQTPKL